MKKILTFILLTICTSCAQSQLRGVEQDVIINVWDLINKIENEKWTKNKILSYFGEPRQTYNEETETLIYDDKNLGYQNWAFETKKDGALISFTFIPNISNRDNFTYDKIIEKWGKDCKKKIETDLTQHFIRKIYSLDCDKNRHASLNRYNEVMSLYVEIK